MLVVVLTGNIAPGDWDGKFGTVTWADVTGDEMSLLLPKVKREVVWLFSVVDELMIALVIMALLVSIFSWVIVLGLIGVNAELDGALLTIKKLVDFDEAGVKVLLLYELVLKFGKFWFDVAAGASITDLLWLKVGAVVLGVEDMTFSKDSAFVTSGANDTTFFCSAVPFVLTTEFVSFVLRILVAGTFNWAGDVVFGKLKVVSNFVSIFALGLGEEKPLGIMAAVDSGVVFTFVVVVDELRVAQLTGCMTEGVTVLTSSAWITTSGLILFSAENANKIVAI